MIYFENKRGNVCKELTKQINELICNTKYDLLSLQYTPQHFGNVVVELISDKLIIRFIYDRGDIYRDKRIIDSDCWFDQQVVYNHSIPCNEIYELLLKAINESLS